MKTVQTTIVCDQCGADLVSHDTPATLFRLQLSAEQIAKTSCYSYAMHCSPPIAQSLHFCNMKCLKEWAA